MSRKNCKGFLFAILASTILQVQAGQTQHSLLDVYKMAEKNDARLAAARASMLATQEGVNQSRSRLLPNLGLSANTQYNKTSRKLLAGGNLSDDYSSHGWGARLTQPLLNMNSWYTFDQAQSLGEQAATVFASAQQQLILRVAEAYFNVLSSEDALLTAKAQERALKQQLDQSKERYNVGLIAETDVLDALAAYDNARVARIQAGNKVSITYENLRTIVNHNVTDIAHLNKEMPVAAPTPNNPDDWASTAISNNLMLKAAREGLMASETNIKVKKSGYAPTLNAFASYNYNSSNSSQMALNGLSGENKQTVIGIQVEMPLFTGGATTSLVRQATYQLEKSQKDYDQLLRETNANTRNLLRTTVSDVDQVKANCQVIISSESAIRATQSGYEVGTRNITEVLDAQQRLYSSISNYLNARYNFIVDTLKLKQIAGTLSPKDLEELNQWMTDATEELSVPTSCRAN